MTLARKAEGYPESPSSRNLKAITMEQRCHFTAVTAMAALQLKVRFHVPGVLFLVIDFLGACFTPKKTELSSTPCLLMRWFFSGPLFL